MQFLFSILAACLILFFSGRQCQATEASKQLDSLKAAFSAKPRVVTKERGSEQYYDVVVENICNGQVENLARQWLSDSWGGSNFTNRLVLITAYTDLPTRQEIIIFAAGNFSTNTPVCQESVVLGVPRPRNVQVTLKLIVASELGKKTADALKAGMVALGTFVNPWLGAGIAVVAASTRAYGAQSQEVVQTALAATATPIMSRRVTIGQIRPTSPRIAEAHFEDHDREWFSVSRRPRPQLLEYDPIFFDARQIVQQINLVTVYHTWDEMLATATSQSGKQQLNLSQSFDANTFCTTFRNELHRSLQSDPLAVRLGLYAHFRQHQFEFSADRANRGCLELAEFAYLGQGR
jgi:hypothetical protein